MDYSAGEIVSTQIGVFSIFPLRSPLISTSTFDESVALRPPFRLRSGGPLFPRLSVANGWMDLGEGPQSSADDLLTLVTSISPVLSRPPRLYGLALHGSTSDHSLP